MASCMPEGVSVCFVLRDDIFVFKPTSGKHKIWEIYSVILFFQQHFCLTRLSCFLQRAYWPRGRVLGGTSSINAMIYIRGSPHDYDRWAKDGAEGWSFKDVLPYFLKSEDNVNADFVKTGKFGFCSEGCV